jgi:hypothetical protein
MKRILAVATLVAAIGCAPLESEHVLTGARQAAFAGDVKVVMEGVRFERAYDEIGIVTATGGGAAAELPRVLDALKREAASLGADAVIGVRYDRGSSGATATGVAVRTRG